MDLYLIIWKLLCVFVVSTWGFPWELGGILKVSNLQTMEMHEVDWREQLHAEVHKAEAYIDIQPLK